MLCCLEYHFNNFQVLLTTDRVEQKEYNTILDIFDELSSYYYTFKQIF